ncbi:hypothetical protein DB346_00985 [Verrucomicrobia bacterium LW23]|nr:hypothetical protein DB346_00985 [Verrucomicrobia bacterium LW23]
MWPLLNSTNISFMFESPGLSLKIFSQRSCCTFTPGLGSGLLRCIIGLLVLAIPFDSLSAQTLRPADETPLPPASPVISGPVSPPVGDKLKPGMALDDDPFTPYLNRIPPQVLREIPAPSKTPAVPSGVKLRHLLIKSFEAQTANGPVANEIYAVVALPDPIPAGRKLPGLLVLHGGAGSCDVAGAIRWAGRGYAAVAVDLPGIGDQKIMVSTGSFKDVPKYGAHQFDAEPDVTRGTVFMGIVAGIDGFKLLQHLPEVDSARLGIVGISWGGYTTTMLCSLLGDQVKAAYSLYGGGFYELNGFRRRLGELSPEAHLAWVKYMDPGYRAPSIRAAFFFAAAANDIFFQPPSIQATYAQVPEPKNVVFVPNVSHSLFSRKNGISVRDQEKEWFDYHLKGEGESFPKIVTTLGKGPQVKFTVQSKRTIVRAQLYYSLVPSVKDQTEGKDLKSWNNKTWYLEHARLNPNGEYTATIPGSNKPDETGDCWYALVTDDRGVSVSSPLQVFRFNPANMPPDGGL